MASGNTTASNFITIVLNAFASIGGLVVAFFLAPLIYGASRDGVFNYAQEHYWDWLAYPVIWLWFLLCLIGAYCFGHLMILGLYMLTMFLVTLWAARRR